MGGLQRTFQPPKTTADHRPPTAASEQASTDQLYRRALKAYELGAWNEVIQLLTPVATLNDDMRTLLAAARWQTALARSRARHATTPPAKAKPGRSVSRAALNGLVAANLAIYAAIIFIVFFVWQRGSFPLLNLGVTQAAQEDILLRQAQSAMAAEEWETAVNTLRAYLDQHPGQIEAQTKLAYATEQRRRAALFAQAVGYFDRKRYDQALENFRRLQATAPDFKPQDVAGYVCKSLAQQIRAQVASTQAAVDKLFPLRTSLAQTAGECPDDPAMTQARRLLNLYIAGLEAAQLTHWEDARNFFRDIYTADPDYAGGLIAQQLYQAYANLGLTYINQSQWRAALEEFNQALMLGVPDSLGIARLRAQALSQAIATATPTATSSPTTTPSPTDMPTRTPTATRTVRLRTGLAVQAWSPTPSTETESPTPEPTFTPSPVPPQGESKTAGDDSREKAPPAPRPTQPAPTPTTMPTSAPPEPTPAPTPAQPAPTTGPPDRPPTPTPRHQMSNVKYQISNVKYQMSNNKLLQRDLLFDI